MNSEKIIFLFLVLLGISVRSVAGDFDQKIKITRGGLLPSINGPAANFTGSARIDPLFQAETPPKLSAACVNFQPGAHSAWHTHPLGQILIVTLGTGWIQQWGGAVEEIRSGDVIWIPPGIKHWHGASPNSAMTHIAIQGMVEGKNIEWLEKVGDEQYKMKTEIHANKTSGSTAGTLSLEDINAVAPALAKYTRQTLAGVWQRPGLSSRDRSLVTLAVLISRNQTAELPDYLDRALDNGVKPGEISEIITHLAFYSGWGNAMTAVPVAEAVFRARGIGPDKLPTASGPLLPMDEEAEQRRAAAVQQNAGPVSAGVVEYTRSPLFDELWLRPALAPRDRSLVTLSALVALGQTAQITYHLNRAMDNGLTKTEASEVFTQLLFYAGWPNVFSAMPMAKEVFEKRAAQNK